MLIEMKRKGEVAIYISEKIHFKIDMVLAQEQTNKPANKIQDSEIDLSIYEHLKSIY